MCQLISKSNVVFLMPGAGLTRGLLACAARVVYTALLIGLLYGIAVSQSYGSPHRLTVVPSGDKSFDLGMQRFAEAVDTDLNLFLIAHNEKPPIAFYTTALPSSSRWKLTYYVDRTEPETMQFAGIVRALIQRRLPMSGKRTVPPWFVAGVYHRAYHAVTASFPEDMVTSSAKLNRAGHRISLQSLMATDISTRMPSTYTVYADVCAVAIHIIHRRSINALSQVILEPAALSYEQLPSLLSLKRDNLDTWFQTQFRHVAKAPRMTPDDAYEELSILVRKLLAPEETDAPIATIINKLDMESIPKKSRREFLTSCYQLRLNSPPLMSNALDQVIAAATYLLAGKERDFLKRMPMAWSALSMQRDSANKFASYLKRESLKSHEPLGQISSQSVMELPVLKYRESLDLYLDGQEQSTP